MRRRALVSCNRGSLMSCKTPPPRPLTPPLFPAPFLPPSQREVLGPDSKALFPSPIPSPSSPAAHACSRGEGWTSYDLQKGSLTSLRQGPVRPTLCLRENVSHTLNIVNNVIMMIYINLLGYWCPLVLPLFSSPACLPRFIPLPPSLYSPCFFPSLSPLLPRFSWSFPPCPPLSHQGRGMLLKKTEGRARGGRCCLHSRRAAGN